MCGISVVNRARGLKGTPGAEYIGRRNSSLPASPLANPRRVGDLVPAADRELAGCERWTAGATLPFYERELRIAVGHRARIAYWGYDRDGSRRRLSDAERASMRQELKRLYDLWQRSGRLALDCYCKGRDGNPGAPCHGDCIGRVLLWIHQVKGERGEG